MIFRKVTNDTATFSENVEAASQPKPLKNKLARIEYSLHDLNETEHQWPMVANLSPISAWGTWMPHHVMLNCRTRYFRLTRCLFALSMARTKHGKTEKLIDSHFYRKVNVMNQTDATI